jgi:hypothetical protein
MTESVASVKGLPGFRRNIRLNLLSPGADGHTGFPTSRQGDEGDVRIPDHEVKDGSSNTQLMRQAESLIDDTESLFDLKRIVVRSLILLVCGRKEVCTCLYAAQVEINGYLLLGSAGDGCSGPFPDDAISALITSDCY